MIAKMKKVIGLIAMGIMVGSLVGCTSTKVSPSEPEKVAVENEVGQEVFPFTLVTKDDQEVTFTKVPERVISCNPNAGEQLMALGLGDKIIGTCYNNAKVAEKYREAYEALPVIAEKAPSLEVVLSLNPDFVYGRSSSFSEKNVTTHDTLSSYGIMSLSSIEGYKVGADVEDVYEDFYNLGKIFQVQDKAEEIIGEMKSRIESVEEKVKDAELVKVFNFDAEMDGGAYTPGNNFTSKLIRHAGGVNVFEGLEKTWNTVNWETVVEANPDVIIINDYEGATVEEKIQALKNNEALSGLKAIQEERFVVVTLPEVFAGARVAETVEKFATAFHPEIFK